MERLPDDMNTATQGQWSKYGAWGLTQYQDEQMGVPTAQSAPKYAAVYEIWQEQGLVA